MSVPSTGRYVFENVEANHVINAEFEKDTTEPVFWTIAATAGAGGTIEPGGLVQVITGGRQAFDITASPGFHIKSLKVDGQEVPYMETRG